MGRNFWARTRAVRPRDAIGGTWRLLVGLWFRVTWFRVTWLRLTWFRVREPVSNVGSQDLLLAAKEKAKL